MARTTSRMLLGAALIVCCSAPAAWAALAVPGGFQMASGYGSDWTPGDAPLLTDQGGGIYDLSLAGLGANALYGFKILDDGGSPPAAWGDPELPNGNDQWFFASAGGTATITLDRNTYSDGFYPTTDRLITTNEGNFATFYATGNWMSEAGGSDWTNNDPNFLLSDQGGGLWAVDALISSPGTFEYKVVHDGWNKQWGANGRGPNQSTMLFTTVEANQAVRLMLDLGRGAIGAALVPEPASALLAGFGCLLAWGVGRRR